MKQFTTRPLLPLLLLTFCATWSMAQTAPAAVDAVQLKSGKIHQGLIIEQTPGESIRLWRNPEADTLMFQMDEIDRIAKIVVPPPTAGSPSMQTPASPARTFNDNPWKVALQASVGGGDYSLVGMGAAIQKSMPGNRAWVGIGAYYIGDQNNYGTSTIPIVLHASYALNQSGKRFAALVFLDAGYSINLGGTKFDEIAQANLKHGNGLHTYGGLRFQVNALRNAGIWLDLGYLRHSSTIRFEADNKKHSTQVWNAFMMRGSLFF